MSGSTHISTCFNHTLYPAYAEHAEGTVKSEVPRRYIDIQFLWSIARLSCSLRNTSKGQILFVLNHVTLILAYPLTCRCIY